MKNKKLEMPSSDDSLVIRFGLSVIFVVFVLIGGWSSFATLAASSVAPGQVSADLNKKTVQHLEGGIVDKIYVKDGDVVKKGELLIKLQDIQLKAQLDILRAQYQEALALSARLDAQNKGLDKVIYPEDELSKATIENQNNIFYTTKKLQKDEIAITQNRIKQLTNQEKGLNSLIKTKENRISSLNEEIKELEILYAQKLVDKVKIREIKREKNILAGDISNAVSQIAKLKEQKSEVRNQQFVLEKEFKSNVLNTFVEIKSKLSDLKLKILASEDTLARTEIVAPIDGVVVGLDIHTEGGVIPATQQILELVPEDSKLIVTAQVQISDIDKVTSGLLADIRFSAFNLNQAHVIEGKVIHVSADSFMDEATGMPYYKAKIEVTKNGEELLKEYNFNLVAGMPAEVMINIGSRTPLSYFLKPFVNMLTRGLNEE